MILGNYKLKNWTQAKTVGTTRLSDGAEVLGKFNRLRKIEATRYGDKIQALSAISNYCFSSKFRKMVVEKYNFKFDLIHPTINDKYWYISVSERGEV
jgi:hypothetical protein